MWNKIYLALLGLSLALVTFFSVYAWSWLQSIGQPANAVAGYEYHANVAWTVLWVTTATLLAAANVVLWLSRRSWAMWITFGYFAVFTIAKYFWLGEAFFTFKKQNGMTDGNFFVDPLFAVMLIFIMLVIVFFDRYIVLRIKNKIAPVSAGVSNDSNEGSVDE